MIQIGRNMTDVENGLLLAKRTLIIDRDTKYWQDFRQLLEQSCMTIIRLPPRSPNLNSYAERFVGSIKAECYNDPIFVGEASLRRAVREFALHCHQERNHQGMENEILMPSAIDKLYSTGSIRCHSRLGGMLNYYDRAVA